MAIFYPPIETIKKFKVSPTDGEWALLNFLEDTLDDSFEVYFTPYLNGDRPDVIIMKKSYGVMIIEVKDWNLNNYEINQKKQWIYKPNKAIVKSPLSQVFAYKENIYNLHVENLLEKNINDPKHFSLVSCAVYFHCADESEIDKLVITPFKYDRFYNKRVQFFALLGRDCLQEEIFYQIVGKHKIFSSRPSCLFTDDIYESLKRLLAPPKHLRNQGKRIAYTKKQREIIYSEKLEQRVMGVFGSGKTTVLAARAVQAYKRVLERNEALKKGKKLKELPSPRILILTYNITLRNFIHDKLMEVNEEFKPGSFTIVNYHFFINAELNNLGVAINVPRDLDNEELGEYLDREYYSNKKLFEKHRNELIKDGVYKYDAVLIDEIQDYPRPWMDIVKEYFRDPRGDYVLFGDEKQNIYGRPIKNKDVVTNVRGAPTRLMECFRSDTKVRDLAAEYQRYIFGHKYVQDSDGDGLFNPKETSQGEIDYIYLPEVNPIPSVYNIIRKYTEDRQIPPNDITILGCNIYFLKKLDLFYRYRSLEKTKTTFETVEIMYRQALNEFDWRDWSLKRNPYLKNSRKGTDDRNRVASLLALYDLYREFPQIFASKMEQSCKKSGLILDEFTSSIEEHRDEIKCSMKRVFKNLEDIRRNKKFQFWMNSGLVKISTVHSFKGLESEVVFLIIEGKSNAEESFNELLYTGITRCQRDLIIINVGNVEWDQKLRLLVSKAGEGAGTNENGVFVPKADSPKKEQLIEDWPAVLEEYKEFEGYENTVRVISTLIREKIPFTKEYGEEGVQDSPVFSLPTGIRWDTDSVPVYLFIKEDIEDEVPKTNKAKIIIASRGSSWVTDLKRALGVKK